MPESPKPRRPAEGPPGGEDFGQAYLANVRSEFGRLRRLAEAAIAQTPDQAALHRRFPDDANSIAILIRHLAGNMRSRWTDFLTTDGEKPGRNRDGEFEPRERLSQTELLEEWDAAFALVTRNLDGLGPSDLGRTVRIRGEAFLVYEAIQRQVLHLAYHVGQIVLLARGSTPEWVSLSIPRGASPDFRRPYKQ